MFGEGYSLDAECCWPEGPAVLLRVSLGPGDVLAEGLKAVVEVLPAPTDSEQLLLSLLASLSLSSCCCDPCSRRRIASSAASGSELAAAAAADKENHAKRRRRPVRTPALAC
jgi:hypothetical protein